MISSSRNKTEALPEMCIVKTKSAYVYIHTAQASACAVLLYKRNRKSLEAFKGLAQRGFPYQSMRSHPIITVQNL